MTEHEEHIENIKRIKQILNLPYEEPEPPDYDKELIEEIQELKYTVRCAWIVISLLVFIILLFIFPIDEYSV